MATKSKASKVIGKIKAAVAKAKAKVVAKVKFMLTGKLLVLAKDGRKAANGITSNVGALASVVLRADLMISKLPKADREKARRAFTNFVLDARPDQERRSISTQLTQIRKAAKVSRKAAQQWIKGQYGEYTVRGVLKAAARSNKSDRFSATREAKKYTLNQLQKMVAWKKANA